VGRFTVRDSLLHLYLPLLLATGAVVAIVALVRARIARPPHAPTRQRRQLGGFRGDEARPGYVWFADVPFDEGDGSKDRPCLVVQTHPRSVSVLKITSQDKRGRTEYTRIATRTWDPGANRTSYLELFPLREVSYAAFRRPAGPCERKLWTKVARLHRVGV